MLVDYEHDGYFNNDCDSLILLENNKLLYLLLGELKWKKKIDKKRKREDKKYDKWFNEKGKWIWENIIKIIWNRK